MASVRIHLPTTYSDSRADVIRVFRKDESAQAPVLVSQVAIGVENIVDGFASFGASYFFTFKDTESGNESAGSPIAYVFRRASTTPTIF